MIKQENKLEKDAKLKALALEKLRSTEGGRNIFDDLKEIIFAGGISPWSNGKQE